MVRTLVLVLTVPVTACVVHTHETPSQSVTSTTSATNVTAANDPHFRVSDRVRDACGIAKVPNAAVEATAHCMKYGALRNRSVHISGSKDDVTHARERLLGNAVAPNRIFVEETDGPAYVDVID